MTSKSENKLVLTLLTPFQAQLSELVQAPVSIHKFSRIGLAPGTYLLLLDD